VWLRVKETEISAAPWAMRLGKNFTLFTGKIVLYNTILTGALLQYLDATPTSTGSPFGSWSNLQ